MKKTQKSKKLRSDFSLKTCALIAIDVIGLVYMLVMLVLYIGTLPVDKEDDSIVSVTIIHDSELSTYDNLKYTAVQLKDAGVIKSKSVFFIKSFIVGEFYNYKEQEYELSPSMNLDEIIRVLSS